ncbi:MAG: hypothetical protein GY711_01695 [bacterium]|nr:hypothetical protein [bacterium]
MSRRMLVPLRAALPVLVAALCACSEPPPRPAGWNKDPSLVTTEDDFDWLQPIADVRPMGELARLRTAARPGGPSFELDAGRHVARLFTGGADAPYELHLNMGDAHFFNVHEDLPGVPGQSVIYSLSVCLRKPGDKHIWKIPPAGEPIGGVCADQGELGRTAEHAMLKGVERLHEWVRSALEEAPEAAK